MAWYDMVGPAKFLKTFCKCLEICFQLPNRKAHEPETILTHNYTRKHYLHAWTYVLCIRRYWLSMFQDNSHDSAFGCWRNPMKSSRMLVGNFSKGEFSELGKHFAFVLGNVCIFPRYSSWISKGNSRSVEIDRLLTKSLRFIRISYEYKCY